MLNNGAFNREEGAPAAARGCSVKGGGRRGLRAARSRVAPPAPCAPPAPRSAGATTTPSYRIFAEIGILPKLFDYIRICTRLGDITNTDDDSSKKTIIARKTIT